MRTKIYGIRVTSLQGLGPAATDQRNSFDSCSNRFGNSTKRGLSTYIEQVTMGFIRPNGGTVNVERWVNSPERSRPEESASQDDLAALSQQNQANNDIRDSATM